MPNDAVLQQFEVAELIQSVDDGRAATDPFKLVAATRTELDTRLADLKAKGAATLLSEGDRAGASAKVRAALDALANHLRDGFNFVRGIGSYAISAPDRLATFTAYGWEQGEIGPGAPGSDARIEALANQSRRAGNGHALNLGPGLALSRRLAHADHEPACDRERQPVPARRERHGPGRHRRTRPRARQTPDHERPRPLLLLLPTNTPSPRLRGEGWGEGPRPDAGAGEDRQAAATRPVPARRESRNRSPTRRARRPSTPRPARSRSPRCRRTRPRCAPSASPGAPGHGGTGRHLDHDHRLSRRAGTGPLTPGVTYEFWLVGHNFRGDGPESNHVTHAVPVGP